MQVIVWTQPNGLLAVCIPTGHVPIETVIAKDVPREAAHRIVDTSAFPLALDDVMFDAVRQTDTGGFTVDIEAARALVLARVNQAAIAESRRRADNTATGVPNVPDDATWLANLEASRAAVAAAGTIDALRTLLA